MNRTGRMYEPGPWYAEVTRRVHHMLLCKHSALGQALLVFPDPASAVGTGSERFHASRTYRDQQTGTGYDSKSHGYPGGVYNLLRRNLSVLYVYSFHNRRDTDPRVLCQGKLNLGQFHRGTNMHLRGVSLNLRNRCLAASPRSTCLVKVRSQPRYGLNPQTNQPKTPKSLIWSVLPCDSTCRFPLHF